ncbi:MAG: HD domain-containing protein [bacterium]|nr:HD domain-containing protein [bacterium]MDZ4285748.1 HD domain-containing protein [Candidatus Sungbacteria bacterium]
MKRDTIKIPREVEEIVAKLVDAGFEAYPVGGCVRDLLRNVTPYDWDITTSAKPEEILALFPESFYENAFLTVTVKTGSEDPALKEIEVTTYRNEGKYTDKRHPDEVNYAKTLDEDLSRRDFTINAMALTLTGDVIDPFDGRSDLEKKLIRSVGDPLRRFDEDALRMMRAVRFTAQLGFEIEEKTKHAIGKLSHTIEFIAHERIRDEFIKMVKSTAGRAVIDLMQELGLLKHIIPELEQGIGMENRPRIFTIYDHNLKAFDYGVKADFPWDVRIAALLHDVAKPATRGPKKNDEWTFYGHDVVGGKMAVQILERLHFPRHTIEKLATLIRWHLFKYESEDETTDSSIRRLVRNVGADNMNDLVRVRICDRMGMDVPKAVPYRLRHFQFRVEKILREEEAPTPKMLKVKGEDIMRILGIAPGPKIGRIIEVLMQEVIDDPSLNAKDALEARVTELGKLPDEELVKIAEAAETKVEMTEDQRISGMKAKYWVK